MDNNERVGKLLGNDPARNSTHPGTEGNRTRRSRKNRKGLGNRKIQAAKAKM